jgi:hypothetical protein
LHDGGQSPELRFADQQMKMLGHNHIAQNREAITAAHALQNAQEKIAPSRGP